MKIVQVFIPMSAVAPCCLLELSLAVLWPFLFSGSDDILS